MDGQGPNTARRWKLQEVRVSLYSTLGFRAPFPEGASLKTCLKYAPPCTPALPFPALPQVVATLSGASKAYSGSREISVPPATTLAYPLTFKPMTIGERGREALALGPRMWAVRPSSPPSLAPIPE